MAAIQTVETAEPASQVHAFEQDPYRELQVDPPHEAVLVEDAPPNGGYGWVCTACVFMLNAHSWGLNSTWGIFLAHYLQNSTFRNASRLEYALIGGLSVSQAYLCTLVVDISTRYFGMNITLLIGTVLIFAAQFGASYATGIWYLFLTQGVCFGWGLCFTYVPSAASLPQWFSTRRSLAIGISSAGAGIGGLTYNLAVGALIQSKGVSWSYRILGFCGLAVNVVCSLLLKNRNKAIQPIQNAFNYREYGHIERLLYSLPDYANSIGLTTSQGSVVGAMLNLGLGVGRPFIGYFSDSFGRINVAALMSSLCGILCLALWVPAKTYGVLIAFAISAGCVCGIFWNTITPVMAEVVGLKRLPSSFGVLCLALVVPATFAEPMTLELVKASGCLGAQIFVGCMFLLAGTNTWLLRSWKINQVEVKAARERYSLEESSGEDVSANHTKWLTPKRMFQAGKV